MTTETSISLISFIYYYNVTSMHTINAASPSVKWDTLSMEDRKK